MIKCSGSNEFKHVVVTSLEKNLFVYCNLFGPCYINVISFVEYVLRILNIIWWNFGTVDDCVSYLYEYHVILEYVRPFTASINSQKYNNMLSFLTSFFDNYTNNYILANIILQRVNRLSTEFRKSQQFLYIIEEIKKYLFVMRYDYIFFVLFIVICIY